MSSADEMKVRVLTVEYPRIVHVLRTETLVSLAFDPTQMQVQTLPAHAQFTAIWDTGATNTVITRRVVETLKLIPIGIAPVNTSNGLRQSYTYLISLVLQNNVRFPILRATEGHISGGNVLIGMDVITQGDFVITNKDGKTSYSFRVPSLEHIDFGQMTT
jgi:predicted aspartyl protease